MGGGPEASFYLFAKHSEFCFGEDVLVEIYLFKAFCSKFSIFSSAAKKKFVESTSKVILGRPQIVKK